MLQPLSLMSMGMATYPHYLSRSHDKQCRPGLAASQQLTGQDVTHPHISHLCRLRALSSMGCMSAAFCLQVHNLCTLT